MVKGWRLAPVSIYTPAGAVSCFCHGNKSERAETATSWGLINRTGSYTHKKSEEMFFKTTCLHLSVCTSQKLLIHTYAVDPAATVMYINTSSFLIAHMIRSKISRLPRYIYGCPCVNTITNSKYASSLTHMPGAKQVNKTRMMIDHANVVAVFLTFGSSTHFGFTLDLH